MDAVPEDEFEREVEAFSPPGAQEQVTLTQEMIDELELDAQVGAGAVVYKDMMGTIIGVYVFD